MFKDAKIFGKINIIDFFIILAVIAAAAFVVWQFRGDGGIPIIAQTETREFYIRFFAPELENFTVEAMSVGDAVIDSARGVSLGTVTYLDIQEARVANADIYGNTVISPREGFSSLEITARLTAPPFEHGIIIAGNRYGIGHTATLRVGSATASMRVSGLDEIS